MARCKKCNTSGFFLKVNTNGICKDCERMEKLEYEKASLQGKPEPIHVLFEMKINDVFTISGRGTVASGKINAGSVRLNDEVTVIGGNQEIKTKVIGIETFNATPDEAKVGDEVGLILDKINKKDVKKGHILTRIFTSEVQEQKIRKMTEGQVRDELRTGTLRFGEVVAIGEEVVLAEERAKNAVASSNGLYPHEILVLNYAHKYFTDSNKFQQFWFYNHGIKDMAAVLSSLRERGFLQKGDLKSSLELVTTERLRTILRGCNLKVSGKKEDLIQRIVDEGQLDVVNENFPDRVYQLTELGKEEIRQGEYIYYIHKHPKVDLDMWSLNKVMHTDPRRSYRDKIWSYMVQFAVERMGNGNFGLYRNTRYSMYRFLTEENETKRAVQMLAEVVFCDVCGTGDEFNPKELHVSAESFFSYDKSLLTLPQNVMDDIQDCQEKLGLSDAELKQILLDYIGSFSAPIQALSPRECVDIIFMQRNKDVDWLKRLYAQAKQRVEEKFPKMKVAVSPTWRMTYIWSTCKDERVRPQCAAMEGKLCLWADPTVYSRDKGKTWIPRPEGASLTHPHEWDGCRCSAYTNLEDVIDKT